MIGEEDMPEVTPCILFKRIVPRLKAAGWQITRGRGLEEGDRIYRPGCKAKGKRAKRDVDFFLCYEEYGASSALVNYVFDNEIVTPEQEWTPHELSTIDDSKESVNVEDSTVNAVEIDVATQPKTNAKRKKTKKKTEYKQRKKARNEGTEQEIEAKEEQIYTRRPDFATQLLEEATTNLLQFVTAVNRRWRNLWDEVRLRNERTHLIPALTEEIEASQQDLEINVGDVARWARENSKPSMSAPVEFRFPCVRKWGYDLFDLVENTKHFIQKVVVVMRRSRRTLCGSEGPTGLVSFHGEERDAENRLMECEDLETDIAEPQGDLRGAMNEILLEVNFVDQAYDSEKTDTDDE